MDSPEAAPGSSVRGHSNETALLAAVISAIVIAQVTFNLLPMYIGALTEQLNLSPDRAGFVGSVDMGCLAISAMLVSPVLHRVSLRLLAGSAAVIALSAHLSSMAIENYNVLLIARGVAGIASGILYAAGSAALARVSDPERAYAKMMIGGMVPAALMSVIAPFAITRWGVAGVFGTMALTAFLGLYLLKYIPSNSVKPAAGNREREENQRPVLLRGSSLILMTTNFMMLMSFGGLWAFSEQIGLSTGLGRETFGGIIAASAAISATGSLLAAWLGTRFGRIRPLLGAILLTGLFSLGMTLSTGPLEFTALLLLWSIGWSFTAPYFMGAGATLDPTGRLVAAMGGMGMIGVATGPTLGGWLLERGGLPTIGFAIVAITLTLTSLLFPVLRGIEKTNTTSQTEYPS